MYQIVPYTDRQVDVNVKSKTLAQSIAVSVHTLLLLFAAFIITYPVLIISGLSDPNEPIKVDQNGISWIGSLYMICVPIGCVVSGAIVEYLGRRKALQIANLTFIVSWLLLYFSDDVWYIYTALAITGLSSGSLEVPILTYVTESVEARLRGTLSSTSAIMSYLGGTITVILAMFMSWRNIALLSAMFHIPSIISLFFVPESPVWLIKKNRQNEAKASLAWLRGWTTTRNIEDEYQQLYTDVIKEEETKLGFRKLIKLFFKKDTLWPFALVNFVMFLSHFTGMSALFTYSVPIVLTLQCPINDIHAAFSITFCAILGSVGNTFLINKLGKRVLTMASLIGMGLCFAGIGVYANVYSLNELRLPSDKDINQEVIIPGAYNWIPFVLILVFTYMSHVGVRVVQWVLMTEVFSHDVRLFATGICCAITFLVNFIVNKTFFDILDLVGFQGMFWFYVCINAISCVIIYYVLPETEGKSLAEIRDHFTGVKKMDNNVYREPKRLDIESELNEQQMNTTNCNENKIKISV